MMSFFAKDQNYKTCFLVLSLSMPVAGYEPSISGLLVEFSATVVPGDNKQTLKNYFVSFQLRSTKLERFNIETLLS